MKHNFHERKQNRIDAYNKLASKNKQKSTQHYEEAHKLGSLVPMGQPILVGHHSERGHRKLIEKIDNQMRKSCEADDKAKYYDERAEAAENNTAIFSDDPEAVTKLTEKIARLKANQEIMKAVNAVIRKHKVTGQLMNQLAESTESDNPELFAQVKNCVTALTENGLTEQQAWKILKPDFMNRIGFAGYSLTNNNANIRNCEKRLERLKRVESLPTTDETFDVVDEGVTVVGVILRKNVEANRIQFIFPGKPSEKMRSDLKRSGFRWSPSEGAWQRHLTGNGEYSAKYFLKEHALPVMRIHFEDKQQDFLTWDIDGSGSIIKCEPSQGYIWTQYKVLNHKELTVGGEVVINGNREMKYLIEKLEPLVVV